MSSSATGGLFAAGLQSMLDGQQRFVRGGLQCFLRVQNFPSTGDFQEVGTVITFTGVGPNGGFTDLFIDPPPEVLDISMHNIGMSGGRIQFGAKKFWISQTFVDNMMQTYPAILDPYNVFRTWDGGVNNTGPQTASVIGLIYGDRLYSIETIHQKPVGGKTVAWEIIANLFEEELAISAGETRIP